MDSTTIEETPEAVCSGARQTGRVLETSLRRGNLIGVLVDKKDMASKEKRRNFPYKDQDIEDVRY